MVGNLLNFIQKKITLTKVELLERYLSLGEKISDLDQKHKEWSKRLSDLDQKHKEWSKRLSG